MSFGVVVEDTAVERDRSPQIRERIMKSIAATCFTAALAVSAHAHVIEIGSIHFGRADGTTVDLIDDFSTGDFFTESQEFMPPTSFVLANTQGGLAELGGNRIFGTFTNDGRNPITNTFLDQTVEVDNGVYRVASRNDQDIFRARLAWDISTDTLPPGSNANPVGAIDRLGHGQSVDYTRGGQAEGFVVTVLRADVAFEIGGGFALEFGGFLPHDSGTPLVSVGTVSAGSPINVFIPFSSEAVLPVEYQNIITHTGIEIYATVPAPGVAPLFTVGGFVAALRRR